MDPCRSHSSKFGAILGAFPDALILWLKKSLFLPVRPRHAGRNVFYCLGSALPRRLFTGFHTNLRCVFKSSPYHLGHCGVTPNHQILALGLTNFRAGILRYLMQFVVPGFPHTCNSTMPNLNQHQQWDFGVRSDPGFGFCTLHTKAGS